MLERELYVSQYRVREHGRKNETSGPSATAKLVRREGIEPSTY